MNMNQWFATTPESSMTTAGIVNPSTQKELFMAHGTKMANVFVEQLNEDLAAE